MNTEVKDLNADDTAAAAKKEAGKAPAAAAKKEAGKAPAAAAKKEEAPAKVKKVRVTIHGGDSEEEKGDVVLVHNFRQILIQRNKQVLIPEVFLEVLKHAAIDTTGLDDSGNKTGGLVPRFAFTVEPE